MSSGNSSVATDIVSEILTHLRIKDGISKPFCIVFEETDTKHPFGFNGHNHNSCRMVTLVVHSEVVDGKACFIFSSINIDSREHRERRASHLPPKWDDESVVFDATNIEGASLYLLMKVRYHSNATVYNHSRIEALRGEHNTLVEHPPFDQPIGCVNIDTFEISKAVLCLFNAVSRRYVHPDSEVCV